MIRTCNGLIATFMIVWLSACSVLPAPGPSSATAAPETVQIQAEDAGSTVTVHIGDRLEVALNGNLTTGYAWEPQDLDSRILQTEGEMDYTSDSQALGASGVFRWRFKAAAAGETVLKMRYHRSFEADTPPLETFEVNIVVQP